MIEIEIDIEIDVRQLSDFDIDFDDSWPSLKVPLEHATIQHLEIIDVLQRTKWPWGAAEAGYDVLIIDSLTHAWAGEGGILEFVDRATQAVKNNFAAWREASPKHNQLVDAILGAPLHVIATIRSKTAWEVVKDERTGKTKPVKIGLAPIQRDGLEYEFTAVLELSVDGHIATATKDRTGLFDGSYFTLLS